MFNWNNKIAFTHELFNSYTSQMVCSETPFYSYYQSVLHSYAGEDCPEFCSLQTLLSAWFAFVRLQSLDDSMECPQCGPNPTVVIADGMSVSFSKNKVIGLKPPTVSDKNLAHVRLPSQSVRTTCFTGPQKLRALIQKMLDDPDGVPKNELLSLIEEVYLNIECFN